MEHFSPSDFPYPRSLSGELGCPICFSAVDAEYAEITDDAGNCIDKRAVYFRCTNGSCRLSSGYYWS